MQHAHQAYGKVAKQTSSPRDLEASLLLNAASRLQAIHDDWDGRQLELREALLYNRKLWTIFLAAVTKDDHPLPAAIRQNVANLGIFVMNQTVAMSQEPQRGGLPILISINRELAAGLQGRG